MQHSPLRRVCLTLTVAALAIVAPMRAQAPDIEAVGTALLERVAAGDLTPQQAADMMAALARSRFEQRLREAGHAVPGGPAPVADGGRPPALPPAPRAPGRKEAPAPQPAPVAVAPEPVRPGAPEPAPRLEPQPAPKPEVPADPIAAAYVRTGMTEFDYERLRGAMSDAGVTAKDLPTVMRSMHTMILDAVADAAGSNASTVQTTKEGLPVTDDQFGLMQRLAGRTARVLKTHTHTARDPFARRPKR